MEDGEISSTAIAQSQLLEGVRKVMVSIAFSQVFFGRGLVIKIGFQFVVHQNSVTIHTLHVT